MRNRVPLIALLPAAALGLMVSCVSSRHEATPVATRALVWPPPPDAPRIRYEKSISNPADIGRSPSTWKRVAGFFTGEAAERKSLVKPFGIALDEAGNLCLTDTGNNSVCYIDFERKQWTRWQGVGKARFACPVAIARRNGVFYVADSELGKVIAFGENGHEVFTIAAPLQRPAGLATSGDSLVVADSLAHAIFVFDLRGKLRFGFGRRGTAAGEFNFPTHVSADSFGHLLVTDSLNSRIQVFDSNGTFVSQIGSSGDAPGHFGRPKGVAADTLGHIYVLDAVYDTVQIFDLSGQLLLHWGEGGAGPGQFGLPSGIAIGTNNQIYVTDGYNRRVQIFKYVGEQ